jgi:hypothetical protein
MADKWFFAHDGALYGPFSAGQLQDQAAAGLVLPLDTVWKEGLDRRVLASKVRRLFADAPVATFPAAEELTAASPALLAPEEPATPVSRHGANDYDPEPAPLEKSSSPSPSSLAPTPQLKAEGAKAETPASAAGPRPPAPEKRQRRVLSAKGALLSSQDGVMVKFRKQCLTCKYLDNSMTNMPIPNGAARLNFYCPKCRKSRQIEIQGVG